MNKLDSLLKPECTVLERAVIARALFLYHSDLQECIEGGVATGVTREQTIETVTSLLCDEGIDL